MTDQELGLQKEIERLQKKIKVLTEAYSQAVSELQEMRSGNVSRPKGRPGIKDSQKAQIIFLYQQGKSMRQVAAETGISVSTVHKVITEASLRTRTVYVYMDREEPATLIDACSAVRRIKIINFTDDVINRAFGVRTEPTWEDYEAFLETRCMPRTRYGIAEELHHMGLDFYDPVLIIEKTSGRVYEDSQWLKKMEADWIDCYDAVVKQTADKEELKLKVLKLLKDMEEVASDGTAGTSPQNSESVSTGIFKGKSE